MSHLRKLTIVALLFGLLGAFQAIPAFAAMTPAPGFAVSDFATGFAASCCGPMGVIFDSQNNLLVTDRADNNFFRFGPSGGLASNNIVANLGSGTGPHGLAFGKDGELYVALRDSGQVDQIDPATGAIVRTLLNLPCATGLATDPISGDLFVSFPGGCNNNIDRISGPATCGTTCTATTYVAPGGTDGLTFAPDGTLYAEVNGCADKISGTNQPQPPTVTQIACPNNGMDGIALSQTSNPSQPLIFANGNYGTIVEINQATSPATMTTIASGGTRGDFVTVGPDGCLYATQTTTIEKVTNANGTCSWTPISVIPQLRISPDQQPPTLIGTNTSFTATVTNVSNPANISVTFTVTGANPKTTTIKTNTAGIAKLSYAGANLGTDTVTATATAGSTSMTSNSGSVQWENATLKLSPVSGVFGTKVSFSGTTYAVSESVRLYWGSTSSTPITTVTSSSTGTISGSFVVPSLPNGFQTVIGQGVTSGHQGFASFQIGGSASLSSASGIQGAAFTSGVHGFLANETVNLYFGTTSCPSCNFLGSYVTNTNGAGAGAFHVPELPGGSYQVTVIGQTSGITLSKPFKLVSNVIVSPSSGTPGTTGVIVAGYGFGSNESVTVTFNCAAANCTGGTVLGTGHTDGRGDFTLSDLTIPQVATGTYPIGAQGANSGLFAKANFSVT